MTDFRERLKNVISGRQIEIFISRGKELRIRAYMDRVNRSAPPDCQYDFEDEEDLLTAIDVLIMRGLELVEGEAKLRGTEWGELFSEDVAAETVKRWQERDDGL